MLEVIGRDIVSPNYWYNSEYDISGYARNNWYRSISILLQQMVSELMVLFHDSSALDDVEDVESMEFDEGIKMKKTKKSLNLFYGKDR